jgi:hypothetical protein
MFEVTYHLVVDWSLRGSPISLSHGFWDIDFANSDASASSVPFYVPVLQDYRITAEDSCLFDRPSSSDMPAEFSKVLGDRLVAAWGPGATDHVLAVRSLGSIHLLAIPRFP